MAMPSLKELSKKWTGPFYAQLVFLPTYLAFLYVALKVITSLNLTSVTATGSDTGIGNAINLFVGFGIVIVMLMIPMAAAVAVTSAVGGDSGLIQKVANGARSYARTAATRGTQKAWTNTDGRVASTLAKSETLKDLAGKKGIFGDLGRLTLKGARGATGDYEKKLAAQVKSRTDFAESLGYDQNKMSAEQKTLRTAEQKLARLKAKGGSAKDIDAEKDNIKDAKARIETLTNKRQLAYTDTLYDHVYHADSVAKAKIKLPIEEKRLTKAKESLDETKADIKQLQNAIRNNPAGHGNINIDGIGDATKVQKDSLDKLNREMLKHVTSLNGIQDNIDNLKLIS